jgi:hypothetical protein
MKCVAYFMFSEAFEIYMFEHKNNLNVNKITHIPWYFLNECFLSLVINLDVLCEVRRLMYKDIPIAEGDTRYCSWLRHCATSWKVMGLRPDQGSAFFNLPNPSSHTRPWGLLGP